MKTPLNPKFWHHKQVLVTGGTGFVGTHLLELLKPLKAKQILAPSSLEADFRDPQICAKWVAKCDIVIHLAANVGGIGYNQAYPGTLFYDNLLMGVHLMEEARKANVKKFVAIGTICAYPKHTPVPFKESELWNGYPEETNAPYGLAKKMMLVQAQAYRKQYGFNAIYLLPVNMYGPGDNFNPNSSHVIPALIKKFLEAQETNQPEVVVWGTGKATREFLFVEDCALAILLATEKYDQGEPVNIGAGFEISIQELAQLIKKITGYEGQIIWDTSKPDGQPRRMLNTQLADSSFGFKAQVTFETGLEKTINWYKKTMSAKAS